MTTYKKHPRLNKNFASRSLLGQIEMVKDRLVKIDDAVKELRGSVTEERKKQILNGIHLNLVNVQIRIYGQAADKN